MNKADLKTGLDTQMSHAWIVRALSREKLTGEGKNIFLLLTSHPRKLYEFPATPFPYYRWISLVTGRQFEKDRKSGGSIYDIQLIIIFQIIFYQIKMINHINHQIFEIKRRELLLNYTRYQEEFYGFKEGEDNYQRISKQNDNELKTIPLAATFISMQQRAWDAINQLTLAYSAGHQIKELIDFFPNVMACWEEYSRCGIAYDNSEESEGAWVAQIPLLGDGYSEANRLICFAILLGRGDLLPRLMPIVDYRNPRTDGLLERLVAPFVSGRGTPPDDCTRHLPYFKTLKTFAAPKEKRPAMMAQYLEDWYHASRRETYHDSHERGINFFGYWSWEAAAITFLLDIDDRSYADAMFYPKDLVDFARDIGHPSGTPALACPLAPEG